MNCIMCGTKLEKMKSEPYHYTDCGLSKVYLNGITIHQCPNQECGEEELVIPNIEKLHEVIATGVATQKNKLLPEEIRFLRKHLGFSGADFARKMGVSPETVTRWEKGKVNMKEAVERLLRVLILSNAGPFRDYDNLESFATIERKTPVRREFKISRQNWLPIAA
ncbi:MAG: helix-turn-helix domain-containing protein [Bacteriovoracaceae bacterium]|nr:helix-turn-helix domain-containing protein [Bacteriovoracaceae bacterium]